MDVETRLLWCMEQLQGFNRADLVKRPHPGGGQPVKELGAIATWVANQSSGQKFAAPLDHPKEKEVVALGDGFGAGIGGLDREPIDLDLAECHGRVSFIVGGLTLTIRAELSPIVGAVLVE